jgi:hypothetical protein
MKSRRLKWTYHVTRVEEDRSALTAGKIPLGMPDVD